MKLFSFWLDENMKEKLRKKADAKGVTLGALIREALKKIAEEK